MAIFNEQERGFLLELLSMAKYKAEKNIQSVMEKDGSFYIRGSVVTPERASDYLSSNKDKMDLSESLMSKLTGYTKIGPTYTINDRVLIEDTPCTILAIIIDGEDTLYEVTSALYESGTWIVPESVIVPIGVK